MAYVPELQNFLETLASSYNLSLGATSFTSSDLSQYSKLSIQLTGSSLGGETTISISQSNNNINFDTLNGTTLSITSSSPSATLEKSFFSAKYLRVQLIAVGTGNITIQILAKK